MKDKTIPNAALHAMRDEELKPIFLRTENNYNTNKASQDSGLKCADDSLAKQSFAEEVDINTIVERFGITGKLPEGIRAPTYGDFDEIVDFKTAMDAIAKAGEAFDAMPADVRARFHNNPAEFVDFCSNDENRAEAEKLGLVMPKPPEKTPMASVGPVTPSKELVPDPKTTPPKAAGEPTGSSKGE